MPGEATIYVFSPDQALDIKEIEDARTHFDRDYVCSGFGFAAQPTPIGHFQVYDVQNTDGSFVDLYSRNLNAAEGDVSLVSLRCKGKQMEVRVGLSNNHSAPKRVEHAPSNAECLTKLATIMAQVKTSTLVIQEMENVMDKDVQSVNVYLDSQWR